MMQRTTCIFILIVELQQPLARTNRALAVQSVALQFLVLGPPLFVFIYNTKYLYISLIPPRLATGRRGLCMYDEVGPQFAHKLLQEGYSYVDGGWIPLWHVVQVYMVSFTDCRLMSTPMPAYHTVYHRQQ